jgi:glutathionylspermidine synthase
LWHGLARADVFLTADGTRICELNSDTPSGQAEAVILGRMAAAERPELRDPNAGLLPRFLAMIETFARRVGGPGKRLTAGIVYPTEFPEDLPLIELYRRCLHDRGHEVVLGSPLNLALDGNLDLCLFGRRVDVLIRHYKTDWWGERMPVWRDVEPYADPAPLDGPLDALLSASLAGRVAVVNPMGAVLTQNKRSLAFMHEAMDRFSNEAREAIRRYVPPTFRLETLDPGALGRNQEEWVLKSDYGCEGDEVIIGKDVSGETWRESLARAIPERWVAQRRFSPRSDCAGHVVNHGVYLVAGEAAGIYGRTHRGATDVAALSLPVLIAEEIGDA